MMRTADESKGVEGQPQGEVHGSRSVLSETIGGRLLALMTLMRREADARMVSLDLSGAQWRPLWLLHLGRADTVQGLSRWMDVDAGAVTRVIDRLESKGFVLRERQVVDRRVVRLTVTASGRAVVAKVPPLLLALNAEVLAGFSADEAEQLMAFLDRLQSNVERATAQRRVAAPEQA